MAKILVKFLVPVKEVAGKGSLEIPIMDNETVGNLLFSLCEKLGEPLRKFLFNRNSLRQNIIIIVNGENIAIGEGLRTKLHNGDQVLLLTPVVGG